MEKSILRKKMLDKRNALDVNQKKIWDTKISEHIEHSKEYLSAHSLCIFVSFGSEFHTHKMIRRALKLGKEVSIPFTQKGDPHMSLTRIRNFDEELTVGHYGILCSKNPQLHQISPSSVELIIVPGLAFDKLGYRIGYGAGYYDRLLGKKDFHAKKLGVCYDLQFMEKIPCDPYDIPVEHLVTEKGFMY